MAVANHAGEAALLQRVRRRAAKEGEMIMSIPPSSRWHAEYGPFAIVDAEKKMIAWGIETVDDLAAQYGIGHQASTETA